MTDPSTLVWPADGNDDSHHPHLVAADDELHPNDGHRWFTDTWWFWWYVPQARMSVWFYHYVRPNIGTSQGGLWAWDHTGTTPLDVPYHSLYTSLRAPEVDGSLIEFPTGGSVRVVDPLRTYDVAFADPGRMEVDVRFDATAAPWVEPASGETPSHLDQFGRVTGTMTIRGQQYDIDCMAIRDRTWQRRHEKWKSGGHGYSTIGGGASALLATSPLLVDDPDHGAITGGFLQRDGIRSRIVRGTRTAQRHPEHSWVTRLELEGEDARGRRFRAVGTPLTRMGMSLPALHGVAWTSLMEWDLDGEQLMGDDQDCWALYEWATLHRARRLEQVSSR